MSVGAPAHEQSGIMSNTAGAVLGKEEVFNETVTVNSTARAELQAAGIDMAFHDLLLASGLDLETLQVKLLRLLHHQATDYTTRILFDGVTVLIQMVADRDLYLASELEKAGILKAGDRIRILKALTRR